MGYGVQSPGAYRFLRDVIREPLPYAAYADLWRRSRREGATATALCQLYLRIANRLQAPLFVDIAPVSSLACAYIAAGCGRTRCVTIASAGDSDALTAALDGTKGTKIVRLRLSHAAASVVQTLAERTAGDTFLILEGIHDTAATRRQWTDITAATGSGIAFDLYRCGLVMPHDRLTRHTYKVNLPRPWRP